MLQRLGVLLLTLLVFGVLAGCGEKGAERNNAGNRLYEASEYDPAIDAYRAAQIADPDRAEFYLNMASALMRDGDSDAAIAALELVLNNDDGDMAAQAYYSLGNVYFEMENYPDAVQAYREVLLLNPDDDDARYNLELALSLILPPTSTALEQQTMPEEGQADTTATPTDNPAGTGPPTPTPTPEEGPPDPLATPEEPEVSDGGEPGIGPSEQQGDMTVEEASRILDPIQHDQQTLNEYASSLPTPVTQTRSGKDW